AHQLFWIYLAPLKSRESAVAAIEDLKKKGIRDFRLINTGDLRNAISLGLFSTQAAVNRRLNELKNKGYQAIIIPYRDAKVIYWIDVKLVNQQNVLNDMLTDVPSRFNSVPVNCSEIALL
ncbi:MAG: SPOR domain-containing protein, partial [Gammaproteobacteria bacterium]